MEKAGLHTKLQICQWVEKFCKIIRKLSYIHVSLFQSNYNIFVMSTLAAARADNFYYPKNYNPEKVPPKKSQLTEDKPFKVVEGQRVGGSKVRYETMFHVRCESCENMIAKGVRFNAIKTWVGNFHTTKIYEFRMKCPHCPQRFVVRTDPQNCDYIYVSGARRIFQAKDCTDESRIRDESIQAKISENPLFKLETQYHDKQEYGAMEQTLQKLQQQQQRGTQDFELNRLLRKEIKKSKQVQKEYLEEKNMRNFHIPLFANNKNDDVIAEGIEFKNVGKSKMIKKEEKEKSERERIKDKIKNLHPSFKKILKHQIKSNAIADKNKYSIIKK